MNKVDLYDCKPFYDCNIPQEVKGYVCKEIGEDMYQYEIAKGTIVKALRNDGYSKQAVYFGKCREKHIVDFNGTSAMLYDNVEVLPTMTKKEAKQKVSELFSAGCKNVNSQKIREIIDLIEDTAVEKA